MDPDREEADVFSDPDDPPPLREEDEDEDEEEIEEEEEEEGARIFGAWMQQYRGGQKKPGEQEEEEEEQEQKSEAEGGRPESRCSFQPAQISTGRRASLPCPATLSTMDLSRLHSSTRAPVTARVLLRRSSSRRLLPTPQEAAPPPPPGAPAPPPERRTSLVPPIPEAAPPTERRGQFRRRNVMSLSDAYSVCLICHHDLQQGTGGTRELSCTHTFHRECIEEWLWRKQCCPTCHVQVATPPQPYWGSTRVKVP
ncbi:LOW QUALITY PROTEIN: uncharacterized protein ACNS7B_016025 [Menidia menidia]